MALCSRNCRPKRLGQEPLYKLRMPGAPCMQAGRSTPQEIPTQTQRPEAPTPRNARWQRQASPTKSNYHRPLKPLGGSPLTHTATMLTNAHSELTQPKLTPMGSGRQWPAGRPKQNATQDGQHRRLATPAPLSATVEAQAVCKRSAVAHPRAAGLRTGAAIAHSLRSGAAILCPAWQDAQARDKERAPPMRQGAHGGPRCKR